MVMMMMVVVVVVWRIVSRRMFLRITSTSLSIIERHDRCLLFLSFYPEHPLALQHTLLDVAGRTGTQKKKNSCVGKTRINNVARFYEYNSSTIELMKKNLL